MTEEVKIKFYRINRCGYYADGNASPLFGGVQSTISELINWAFDGRKPLSETCTYEMADSPNILRTFCFDKANSAQNRDVVLVTWNETESLNGNFSSVNGTQPAGQASVATSEIPNGHIPGFPTYFWIIPNKNIFASLRFGQRENGHKGLQALIAGFLESISKHAIKQPEGNNGIKILGYRENYLSQPIDCVPHFNSSPQKKTGPVDFLRHNRPNISKIIHKSVLTSGQVDDRSMWEKCMHMLGIVHAPPIVNTLNFKAEIPFTPSSEQLDQIIEKWNEHGDSKWADAGFQMHGSSDITWLSHQLVKAKTDLEISRNENGVISAASILEALLPHRERFISLSDSVS